MIENAASALLRLRDSINVAAVDAATRVLRAARRIEFYAVGNTAVVALDGQLKFFRFRAFNLALAHTGASASESTPAAPVGAPPKPSTDKSK